LLTACRETPSLSASASCDRPACFRQYSIFSGSFISVPPFHLPLYQNCGCTSTDDGWNFRNRRLRFPRRGFLRSFSSIADAPPGVDGFQLHVPALFACFSFIISEGV
jgi:hypothetical protein